MPLLSNNVATFDSEAAKIEVFETLVKTSRVWCPVVQNHMTIVPSTGSRIEYFDQNLGNDKVTLASGYTAGSGTMTIAASSLINSYSIKVGVHQLMTPSGSATFNITGYNPANNTVSVTLAKGTDGSLLSGSDLWLVRSSAIGENASSTNDVQYATSDYNYLSNFSFTIRIANPNKNGQIQYHFEEITFDNQLENNIPEAMRTLERRALKDFRLSGTGGVTRNGNTVQGGNASSAGGILTLAAARGLYTASGGSVVFNEDVSGEDIEELRLRGAFNTINDKTRDFGLSYCKAYCGQDVIGMLNKYNRQNRAPEAYFGQSDKLGGTAGTFTNTFVFDNVLVEYHPTQGLANNEVFYLPQEDNIEIRVVRLMEEQEPIYAGDNEIRTYQVTYTTKVSSPWLMGLRSNFVKF
jgi:hypothetical protein